MDLLKKAAWTFVVAGGSALALGGGAQAAEIFKLTFDSTGTAPGDASDPYTADAADVIRINPVDSLPYTLHRSDGTLGDLTPQVVTSDGPQGGLAMETFSGPNKKDGDSGYRILDGNDIISMAPGGGFTWEALVKLKAYDKTQSDNDGQQHIVGQGFGGRLDPRLRLGSTTTSDTKPQLEFEVALVKNADDTPFSTLSFEPTENLANDGQWHHIAATFKVNSVNAGNNEILTDGEMRLYLDGVEVASAVGLKDATGTRASATYRGDRWGIGLVNQGGTAERHRSLNGFLDAVALSDEALTPGSFVLPIPEPASLGLMGLGAVLVFPRRP